MEFQKNYVDKDKPQKKCEVCGEELESKLVDSTFFMRLWKLEKPGWITIPCRNCWRMEEAERIAEEQKKKEIKRLNKLIDDSMLKKRFREKTFENYQLEDDANQKKAFHICKKFADELIGDEKIEQGKNLVLIGSVGTGKSHLASAVCNAVMRDKGIDCLHVKLPTLFRKIKATFDRRNNGATQDEIVNSLINVKLLVLDEVGRSLDTRWENMILFDILSSRYDECKSTILISNLNFDQLSAVLGESIVDRLYENDSTIVVFDWRSYRKKMRRKQNPSV